MSKNWIWAGGFLALVLVCIGYAAKAGVESGQEALKLSTIETVGHASSRAEQDAHVAVVKIPAEARAVRAKGAIELRARRDVGQQQADEAPAAMAPAQAELVLPTARAVMAPAKVTPRLELAAPAANTTGRLLTPASELDIAFATGRIDRLPAINQAAALTAKVEATKAEALPDVESTSEAPTVDNVDVAAQPENDTNGLFARGFETWTDETDNDTFAYAPSVEDVRVIGLDHARI